MPDHRFEKDYTNAKEKVMNDSTSIDSIHQATDFKTSRTEHDCIDSIEQISMTFAHEPALDFDQ